MIYDLHCRPIPGNPQTDKFRSFLTENNLIAEVDETTDSDTHAKQITDALIYSAERSIFNKVVTIRPSESPWIISKTKSL